MYRREFRRFHRSFWGAVALLILLGFLLQNVAGSVYYSLVMQSGTAVSSPPVELQEGTVGNSTIYENKTSALVSVDPSGGGTDVEDYVDNNTTNLDGSADKGTHSNFTAQKYGPDSINDTLTETTSVSSEWLDVNAYDSTYQQWAMAGASPWLGAQDQPTNMISTAVDLEQHGWFDFPNTTLTGSLTVNISIYCNNDDGAGDDRADVYVDYTGSGAGSDVGDVAQHTAWQYDTIDLGAHTVDEVNNFRVYFQMVKYSVVDDVRIDHVSIGVSENALLDLEVQWTNVDYDEPYEFLCIYGGPMDTENIMVDAWNGSDWENLFNDLDPGWNNVTVKDYLASSNFTIRYRGGTETGDTTVSTWKIDAAVLHVWSAGESLGSATTVTLPTAQQRATGYGKDRVMVRTTDENNTLHVFEIGDATNNDMMFWYRSTDNGETWSNVGNRSNVASLSVAVDSDNRIHIVNQRPDASIWYRKQLYNASGFSVTALQIDSVTKYQPDIAIAPYNNNWIYIVYDEHSSLATKNTEVYVKTSTNGGSSFGVAETITYNEYTTAYTAGTFPSVTIDNTKDTYGHIYVTWFNGHQYLYIRNGTITSTGSVNWRADPAFAITSGMSDASTTVNTNMMHSAMYLNGKYRVVYCESGTAKYSDWDEILFFSEEIPLATVSHYPSITYDWNNYTYVFYHTDDANSNYDIRYQRSSDTTPTSFGNAQNVTADNNGNRYVSTKLGGDNNRVEFVWTYGTSDPYQVKYNYLSEGSEGDFDYVLKAVEKDNSNWKVRLKAYDDTNKDRLDNCTISFNGESQPITNMNFTSNTDGWSSAHTYNGTEVTWTEITWDSGNGNPSPGSAGGSAYGGASESSNGKQLGTVIYNFSYTFTAPASGWTSVTASFAWKFTASGTYTNNVLNSVKLLLTDNSDVVLEELYVDDNSGSGWTGQASVGYYYRTNITVSASMTAGNSYKLKVQFMDTDTVNADDPSLTFRIDDVGITFNYGNSNQIIIIDGSYTQQTGSWYDLAASGTIYFVMHVETSMAGTSYVYVYLEILVPNTTVYARYIITFEIT